MSLLTGLISSSTRIRILMRLFTNPENRAYPRELAKEFGCSTGQIGYELKQLHDSQLLDKEKEGRTINYRANHKHPLFPELRSMVMKALGMDRIVETVLENLGDLELALLVDDYAEGKDSGIVDLILVGNIDATYLRTLTRAAEKHIKRTIRALAVTRAEFKRLQPNLASRPGLILWSKTPIPGSYTNGADSASQASHQPDA